MQEILTEIYNLDPLFEASPTRSPILKRIDKNFKNLKDDIRNNDVKRDLILNIKDFTNIQKIRFSIKKNFDNAVVITLYNQNLSKDFFNKNISTNFKYISKYIKNVYIIFGDKFFDRLSSMELTAVLLHELGHSFAHTSNLSSIFNSYLVLISSILMIPVTILSPFIATPIMLTSLLILFTVNRTAAFRQHYGEYGSDKFASRYGYADEMIRVLHKFHLEEKKFKEKQMLKKGLFLDKIVDFIIQLWFPKEHPNTSERVCKAANDLMSDYKSQYPKLKNDLNIIFSDLKCKMK